MEATLRKTLLGIVCSPTGRRDDVFSTGSEGKGKLQLLREANREKSLSGEEMQWEREVIAGERLHSG